MASVIQAHAPSTKAVILVGGPSSGTRFRPLSLKTPKPLFPVAGHELLTHQLNALAEVPGLIEVILIGFFDNCVFDSYIRSLSYPFRVCYRREYQALGTAGGLFHFRDEIMKGGTKLFFVMHSDVVVGTCLNEIRKNHLGKGRLCTIFGTRVPRSDATRYGSIIKDPKTSEVTHYVEKPEGFISDLVNTGIYLMDVKMFQEMSDLRDKKARGNFSPLCQPVGLGSDTFSVPEALNLDENLQTPTAFERSEESPTGHTDPQIESREGRLRLEQDFLRHLVGLKKIFVFEDPNSFWKQIKSAASALEANRLYLDSINSRYPSRMGRVYQKGEEAPTIIQPVFIHPQAKVSSKATVGPHVSVGPGAVLHDGCRVRDAIVLDGAVLQAHCCVLHSIIGWDSIVGKWSRVEGNPRVSDLHGTSRLMIDGQKVQSATILGEDVTVYPEVIIRNCIVLPHKELKMSFKDDILM